MPRITQLRRGGVGASSQDCDPKWRGSPVVIRFTDHLSLQLGGHDGPGRDDGGLG